MRLARREETLAVELFLVDGTGEHEGDVVEEADDLGEGQGVGDLAFGFCLVSFDGRCCDAVLVCGAVEEEGSALGGLHGYKEFS